MRLVSTLAVVLACAPLAVADDVRVPRARRDVLPEVFIPVVPEEHQRLHYFGRRDRHVVPGAVSINRAPYRCDVDRKAFDDRDSFVAHLQTAHKTPLEEIPDRIVLRDGQVHFVAR